LVAGLRAAGVILAGPSAMVIMPAAEPLRAPLVGAAYAVGKRELW
jgi:hypothetical protein